MGTWARAIWLSMFVASLALSSWADEKKLPIAEKAGSSTPKAKAAPPQPSTLAELVTQLKDPAVAKRRMAAQQLGARGVRSMEAVPALIEALGDPEPAVRASVAEAIGGIGITAKSAVPALLKSLKDPDPLVRETAAEALSDIGADAPKIIPALVELLNDEDMNVCCAGARAIGDFRAAARDAVPALQQLQKQDKHPLVREAAAEALQIIQKAMQRLDS